MLANTCFTGQVSKTALFFSWDCRALCFRAVQVVLSENKYVKSPCQDQMEPVHGGSRQGCSARTSAWSSSGPSWVTPQLASAVPPNFPSWQHCKLECVLTLPLYWRVFKRTEANWLVLCFSLVSFYCWLAKLKKVRGQEVPLQIWEVCT